LATADQQVSDAVETQYSEFFDHRNGYYLKSRVHSKPRTYRIVAI